MRLKDKVALVTGASRGIGAAICRGFSGEGALVAINHPPEQGMRELAEMLARDIVSDGGRACTVEADVSDWMQVRAMVETITRELGSVDVLVANAAATELQRWTEIDQTAWDHIMAVNLRGAFVCAREVFPSMREKGYGKIITVSSITVALGDPGCLHYVVSKAGLVGLTRALAREIGRDGIRVNCVMPGSVLTEQTLAFTEWPHPIEGRTSPVDRQSVPGRLTPADMVGTFIYLASPESDAITGQVITVDAGAIHW